MATTLNLPIKKRGDTYLITIRDVKLNGVAYDIQGCTFFFTVKRDNQGGLSDDSEAVLKKTWTIATGTPVFVTTQECSSSEMNLPEYNYFYDLQIKDINGRITTWYEGTFPVRNDITKRTTA